MKKPLLILIRSLASAVCFFSVLAHAQTVVPAAKSDGSNVSGSAWKTNLAFLQAADVSGLYAPINSPTFTGTVVLPSTTSIGTVSNAEIGWLDGVASAIQTQLDGKQATIADGGLALSKLAQTSASTGQVLKWNGSAWAPGEDTGGTVDNAAVNSALDENPNASLHSIGAPREGFAAFGKASTINSDTRNGIGNAKRLNIIGIGDSIYSHAYKYLRSTIGYGGTIRPLISDNTTLSGSAKLQTTVRTWTVTSTGNDELTSSNHGFVTGDYVVLSKDGGAVYPTSSPQLADGNYYIVRVDQNVFKLATSRVNAFAGTVLDFTTSGSGSLYVNAVNGAHYYKSPQALFASVGTGTITVYPPANDYGGSTSAMMGREVIVWYWSQTGGGSWTLEYDNNTSGSYATLHATSPSSTTITTNGTVNTTTGVVDATDGGTDGALKWVKYVLPNYYNLRLRFNGSGSTGAGQICSVGVLESPYSINARIPGVAEMLFAYSGTRPSEWDDISDTSLATILNQFDPDVIFVRGYEDIGEWQTEFVAYAARIRAIKPGVQFVVIGMHPILETLETQESTLDATDLFLQDWCDDNNGTYIPMKNRLGTINDMLDARFFGTTTAVNLSSASGDTITTATAHGFSVGKRIIISGLTGTSTLTSDKWRSPYEIASTPTLTTFTLRAFNDGGSVSVGGTVTGGTVAMIDGTHPTEDGKTMIDAVIASAMPGLSVVRETMDGMTVKGISPWSIQTAYADANWRFARPSNKDGGISIGRTDGGSTSTGYYTSIKLGANSLDNGYLAGTNGGGLAFTQNPSGLGIIGFSTNNSTNWAAGRFTATVSSRNDLLEITSGHTGTLSLVPLAVSASSGVAANFPTQVWRHSASNTSKGTEYALMTKDQGLVFNEVTQGITFKAASNGRIGTGATLASGTVTVSNTSVTANTQVIITKTAHGGTGGASYVVSKSAGASFTITAVDASGATVTTDASVFDWLLVERN